MDQIVQTNTQLMTKSFYEVCPNCDNETKISIKDLRCKHCGTVIKPCSLCNNDGCDGCKVVAAHNRIMIFHRNASEQKIYIEEFTKGGKNQ